MLCSSSKAHSPFFRSRSDFRCVRSSPLHWCLRILIRPCILVRILFFLRLLFSIFSWASKVLSMRMTEHTWLFLQAVFAFGALLRVGRPCLYLHFISVLSLIAPSRLHHELEDACPLRLTADELTILPVPHLL